MDVQETRPPGDMGQDTPPRRAAYAGERQAGVVVRGGCCVSEAITRLLNLAAAGDAEAAGEVFPLIYDHLRQLAAGRRARLPHGETLQTTALVHEAYLRLVDRHPEGWSGERHFYFTAVRAMRDILVEEARRVGAEKRGGDWERVELSEQWVFDAPPDEVLTLERALGKLQDDDPQGHELVLLRYYTGLSLPEIATLLEVPLRTLERRWRFLRAWLARELEG